jgi:site-specific DNA-methyltransferase (adenine-specific)
MIYHGDCLEIMPTLEDKSVDMIMCDLPYGTTACHWDSIIPFEPLWAQYKRLIKDNGAIVLTASQPFTSALVMSNPKWFKYEWVWEKSRATGHVHAKNKPMKIHENIAVFSGGTTVHAIQSERRMTYNPQGLKDCDITIKQSSPSEVVMGDRKGRNKTFKQVKTGYPTSIIEIPSISANIHPTQKPVALFEYLIRTYTNEGDTVLDNCAGSFTTAIACMNTNRQYICIEKDDKYFEIGKNRIENHQPLLQAVNS